MVCRGSTGFILTEEGLTMTNLAHYDHCHPEHFIKFRAGSAKDEPKEVDLIPQIDFLLR